MTFFMCKIQRKVELNVCCIRRIVMVLVAVAVIQKEQLEELHLLELNNISIVNFTNLKSIKPTFHPRTISHVCQILQ